MPKPGLRVKSVVKPVVVLKNNDLFSRNENVGKIADVAEQTAVGEGEWTSHTTTSSEQWCKECQSLVSTLQSLDDHVVEFHGGSKKANGANKQGMNNSSIVLGPKSKTIGSKGTSLSMQDTQNLDLDKSLPEKTIKNRKVSKKSTTARKVVVENRKPQSQDSSPSIQSQSYFCQICALRFDTIVARNTHEEIHSTDTEAVEKPGILEKTEVDKEEDTNDNGDPGEVDKDKDKKLFCYDCYTLVEKRNYVKHLIDHDEEKRVTQEHWLNGTTPSRKRKAPEPTTLLEEKEDRKYLYLNPNDPRRNLPNAILQCPVCPMQLFFSTATYQKHCDACQPLIKSRKQDSLRGK